MSFFDRLQPYALGELELVAAYVLLAVILLAILIWARLRWWIKAAAIVLTIGFFFVEFASIRQISGWPTNAGLPDRFELVYAVINEPNEAAQTSGAIILWVMELPGGPVEESDVYTPGAVDTRLQPDQEPRAYRLPYSRETHREVEEAKVRVVEGARQIGVSERRPRKPGEHAPQSKYTFFDRPDPILAPKDPPPES